jgi:hypothetical protein
MKNIKYLACSLMLVLTILVPLAESSASAATDSGFQSNDIIDDSVFDNTSSMSASQINTWLNSNFPHSCISTNNGFTAPDPKGYSPSGGFTYGSNVSAGQIISDAAQTYGLNPQVLLATLEKEQSLVSGGAGCTTLRYTAAVGYGCPDGGAEYSYSGVDLYSINGAEVTSVSDTCVNTAAKSGFSEQVIHGAWLLKFGEQRSQGNVNWDVQLANSPENGDSWDDSDDPQSCYSGPMTQGTYQVCPSGSSTYYDGYTTIDGTSVHMNDGATAALYWYTPHFSGNENFYSIFNSWFGSSTGDSNANTLNFVRLNYYTGDVQLIGYPSIGNYSYTSRNTTVPYPDNTSVDAVFRPNGDLSFISLDDPSGKVKITTYSAFSDFQQLSSVIYVPYPAQTPDGSVVPMFRPNGDLSFVRLNYYTGHTQVVTYSFSSYFQNLSSNIVTAYPDVPINGSVVPMFRPNGDLSFVRLNYYTGNVQVATYSLNSYFQSLSSNILTPYPDVPINGSVVPMFQPNDDLSFLNMSYSGGSTQIVTYSYSSYFQNLSSNTLTAYPTVSDFTNVKPLISTAF